MGLQLQQKQAKQARAPRGLLLSRPLSPGPVAPRRNSHHRGAEGQAGAQRRRQGRLRDRGRLCARPSEKALPLPLRGSVRRTQWAQQHERRRAPRQGQRVMSALGRLGLGLGLGSSTSAGQTQVRCRQKPWRMNRRCALRKSRRRGRWLPEAPCPVGTAEQRGKGVSKCSNRKKCVALDEPQSLP